MLIAAIKTFPHYHLGLFEKGVPKDVDDKEGARLCAMGLAQIVAEHAPAAPTPPVTEPLPPKPVRTKIKLPPKRGSEE